MDVAFASWLDKCPDKVRFVLQYNDLRSDIARVIETFGYEFASIEVEKEVTNTVLNKLINQDSLLSQLDTHLTTLEIAHI